MLLCIVIVLCVRNKRTSIKDKPAWASPQISILGQDRLNENRSGNNQRDDNLVNGAPETSSPNGTIKSTPPHVSPASGSHSGDSAISSVNSGPYATLATGGQENSAYATILEEPYYLAPVSSNSNF